MNSAVLAFEDGTVYRGKPFGAKKTVLGEAVFNTSMMAYQELLTDPSNYMNILVMTFVEIGCYGINGEDSESDSIKASGLVVAGDCEVPSNWRSRMSLGEYLEKNGIPGISGVDTRTITRKIRMNGSLKACLSTDDISDEEAVRLAKAWCGIDGSNFLKDISCPKAYHFDDSAENIKPFELGGVHINTKPRTLPLFKCAAVDYGVKKSLLSSLAYSGFDVTVFPSGASAEEILEIAPQCVFLSSGAGDPSAAPEAAKTAAKLMEKLPVFGVGFGHQVITHALGAKTYRLKFGHHGGNYPVRNLETGKVKITSQNHSFAADAKSLENTGAIVTEINIEDNSVEGLRHKDLPVFSVQYHPESAPGGAGAPYPFDVFYELVKKNS
ncbi:MAG: glutamine-hydrolyzing carbamoyl-phosphate synthase small subunit [Bacilli bacterium]